MKTLSQQSFFRTLLPVTLAVFLFGGVSVAQIADRESDLRRAGGAGLMTEAPAVREGPVSGQAAPVPPGEGSSRGKLSAKRRCDECGVIESVREIDSGGEGATQTAMSTAAGRSAAGKGGELVPSKLLRRYELIVRMNDGSRHVIPNAQPGIWKIGERVVAIAPTVGRVGTVGTVRTVPMVAVASLQASIR